MGRLDINRQIVLEPKRMELAIREITKKGYEVKRINDKEIRFQFKNEMVIFFPYSGWHSGKSIVDGRGLNRLLTQI